MSSTEIWERFKRGEFVVNCKTAKDAKLLCRMMGDKGMHWGSGSSYYDCTKWEVYQHDTCYSGSGRYADCYHYDDDVRVPIISFDTFVQATKGAGCVKR